MLANIACLLMFVTLGQCNVEYDGWLNIRLQHSFGLNGEFVERGNVSVQSVRSGSYTLDQPLLKADELARLRDPSNADRLYRLRSSVQSLDGVESEFLSSVKLGTLAANGLRDTIKVWVLNNGAVAAVGISPSLLDPSVPVAPSNKFISQVHILHMEQAPVPDTASYIQKLEREREARDKGEFKDNRSFIAKYWMYIVPVVIFVLLSGAANPEQQAAAR